MSHAISDEVRYKLLKLISERPDLSQRELAEELGVSLGKLNYCLRALMEKGLVKARNFKNSRNKAAYAYILTRRGVDEKVEATYAFLRRKIEEHKLIVREIERLKAEVSATSVVEEH